MHIINKAMKLFSISLFVVLALPSLFAFQAHNQNLAYTHPAIVVKDEVSYLSVQDVPAGTTITSTTYWTPLLGTAPSTDPGTPPTTEPDTSDSDLGNLSPPDTDDTEPEDNDTIAPAPDSRLINLSTRGFVGTRETDQHMVGGFFINGSESLKVFVKCNGPTLGQLGVTGSINDLKVTIKKFPSEEVVLENDNWSPSDVEWSEIVEAYQPLTDKDAAAFVTLSPGLYTTEVEGVNGATGNGQIEIYTYRELQKR